MRKEIHVNLATEFATLPTSCSLLSLCLLLYIAARIYYNILEFTVVSASDILHPLSRSLYRKHCLWIL